MRRYKKKSFKVLHPFWKLPQTGLGKVRSFKKNGLFGGYLMVSYIDFEFLFVHVLNILK